MSININEQFAGYDVPEIIKNTTVSIMERFTITGLCDGMYIANTIAMVDGTGDGNGNFTSNSITKYEEIAAKLHGCYGCNIFDGDEQELAEILATRNVNSVSAVRGLRKYINRCEAEKKTCDEWRVDYLDKCIDEAKKSLKKYQVISALNSMCFDCAKLGKECGGTKKQLWTGCIYKTVEG